MSCAVYLVSLKICGDGSERNCVICGLSDALFFMLNSYLKKGHIEKILEFFIRNLKILDLGLGVGELVSLRQIRVKLE